MQKKINTVINIVMLMSNLIFNSFGILWEQAQILLITVYKCNKFTTSITLKIFNYTRCNVTL